MIKWHKIGIRTINLIGYFAKQNVDEEEKQLPDYPSNSSKQIYLRRYS
jgi:hypothetical protein